MEHKLTGYPSVMLSWPQIEGAVMQSSMDANEEGFLNCARYGLMLAERIEDDATRANLIKLVRAWLTAAKEIEKAGSNVLVQISAQL